MATLALTHPLIRPSALSALSLRISTAIFARPAWSLPCVPSTSSVPLTSWYAPLLPALDSLLELFPPFLLTAPKKKTSHSRKSMRSANKGLKNRTNFSHCAACGQVKLMHNVCPYCYSQISRRWKKEARGEISETLHIPKST
ncbi:hypothetical protein TREMEDRAFT_65199 [Tremella mesenterica DSM 1558]|uniref:uncharacterized protein n=1 Tax=Tremella mesenterica (strain ATCC 24925 / CBS 8224 / DSM 1558 / NBRC 9311 / NRRL Y-6157 / RJB 2259-6 / UBC 559-6) TaxID=578456 RepID=UPI00032CE2C0|nr:uncharacterized protein TREMEDRAFT_65199 [Tremella mesenterica DSM 1558]EIW66797.1 hypothetical protein TREMEDRAFT_65199 [Tremella mesenterica DSM 1558]